MVNMLGLGLGPVVAGLLAGVAPYPLVLLCLVHLGLLVVAAVAVVAAPEPVTREPGPVRWQVQRLVPMVVVFAGLAPGAFASLLRR